MALGWPSRYMYIHKTNVTSSNDNTFRRSVFKKNPILVSGQNVQALGLENRRDAVSGMFKNSLTLCKTSLTFNFQTNTTSHLGAKSPRIETDKLASKYRGFLMTTAKTRYERIESLSQQH